MKTSMSIFAAIGLAITTAIARPESDTEVAARKAALDLAGAFSNEGFKMRDGHWSGTIKPKEILVLGRSDRAGEKNLGQPLRRNRQARSG